MSDVNKAAAVVRDIALKAIEPVTGQLKTEYTDALTKANNALQSQIDDLKAAAASRKADARFAANEDRMARKSALNPMLKSWIKSGNVAADLLTKTDNYVRFEAPGASLLLQPTMAAEINRQVLEISPVLQVCNVQDVSGPSLVVPVQTAYLSAYWADELEASTQSKDTIPQVEITPFELRARVGFSQSMLDDAAYDVEGYTMQSIVDTMAAKIGNAALAGNGVKKPQGMIDNVDSYTSGSLTLAFDQLIELKGQIKSGYLTQNAGKVGWMANRVTIQLMRALAISSTAVQYAWTVDGTADNPERLLGYPVFEAAEGDMASPSNAGAYTSGQKPILFGNFYKAYGIARKPEFHVIRDPYTGAANFQVYINAMQRIDGRVLQTEAVHALNMATS